MQRLCTWDNVTPTNVVIVVACTETIRSALELGLSMYARTDSWWMPRWDIAV